MAEGSRETNLDVFLNEDSDNDIETSPDIIGEEEYNVLFDSEDDESDFEGFQESLSPIKNRNGNNIGNNNNNDAVNNVENNDEPAVSKKKNPDADAPAGFKMAEFRMQVIKQMIESAAPALTAPKIQTRPSSSGLQLQRLAGRHFPRKIEGEAKTRISRSCKVCVSAERSMDVVLGRKRKRPGHESSYECAQCEVALCVAPCFSIFHTQKNYEEGYKAWKKASEWTTTDNFFQNNFIEKYLME